MRHHYKRQQEEIVIQFFNAERNRQQVTRINNQSCKQSCKKKQTVRSIYKQKLNRRRSNYSTSKQIYSKKQATNCVTTGHHSLIILLCCHTTKLSVKFPKLALPSTTKPVTPGQQSLISLCPIQPNRWPLVNIPPSHLVPRK